MKTLVAFILFCFICYLILKLIRRAVFLKIYKAANAQQREYQNQRNNSSAASKKEFKKDIKWDAETVDYEEVKD